MKLKDLPVGAKISDGKRYFPWIVAEQASGCYPGTVVLADFLAEAGCFDAPEPGSRFDTIRQFGWNRYPVSNVHAWLNDPEADWYRPTHPQDMPPASPGVPEGYAGKPGFLHGFSLLFLAALVPVEVTYAYQDDYYQLRHGTVKCRVFLPSRTELGMEDRPGVREGEKLCLADFRDYLTAYPTEALAASHDLCDRDFHPSTPYPYWLRSVDTGVMSAVFYAGMGRAPWFHACQAACGIRPMAVLDREVELEEQPDRYGVYLLKRGVL